MASAEVKVRLRKGDGDQLAADCVAEFVLEDHADKSLGKQEFLVAFPVTGLSSKIVTISNFKVQIDGKEPAMVFRQAITVSKWEIQTKDSPIHGKFEARFSPRPATQANFWKWGVRLADETTYRNAYAWVQMSMPGMTTRVRVTYTATLRPQKFQYSKSYESSPGDEDVIPFAAMQVSDWTEAYYFFDYILVSGSTWDGPIGRETIEFSADPALGLSLSTIECSLRMPAGYSAGYNSPKTGGGGGMSFENDVPKWTLSGKPDSDFLFSIPVSALGKTKAGAKK